jgi:hypothetical protein
MELVEVFHTKWLLSIEREIAELCIGKDMGTMSTATAFMKSKHAVHAYNIVVRDTKGQSSDAGWQLQGMDEAATWDTTPSTLTL